MDHQQFILDKLSGILNVTDKTKGAELLKLVEAAGRTFIGGAGRSLLVSRFFAMRLVHAGYNVSMIGEVVTPAIKAGDLLILVSGSGGTETLLPFVKKAKSVGAKLVVVSMKKASPMADAADLVIQIGQDDSFPLTKGMPMGSQFELSTLIFLEGVISELIHAKGLTEEGMRAIHANLE
ncbi:SIS domain-containing protein [Methylovorus menthalis]|uniref:6-phospho-3-hexuloisomerase n=1 Tax=Methylovorus menthalis TaxID=1002227 RepID=UPI001E3CEBED|nr:6-phospho-3-hexuloisomerase [Methylovorus menthalis]MCB4811610.1 SIS domain-containing protein [Methylovorus menthalis]